MSGQSGSARTRVATSCWLAAGALLTSWGGLGPATAAPLYTFVASVPLGNAALPFTGYDLSTFDPATQLYYLADRSNNGIDVLSAKTNSFVERIGSGLFAGTQGGNNDIAGPNGVSISNTPTGKLLIAGNGASNFLTFNLDTAGLTVVGSPRTTSTAVPGTTPTPPDRVDGVAASPASGPNTILAANNASDPGFLTLVNNATGSIIRTILLDGTNGTPNVGGNGVEATIYNTARGTFFVAIPSFNPAGTGAGGAIEVNATTGAILNTYDFNALGLVGTCSPTGLVQGAGSSMFIACSDPTAGKSIVLNPTGSGSLTVVNGISGGDETAYDPARNVFFEAARFQPGGPVLGIVDGATDLLVQTIAIGGNDHSVAVDPVSGEVFVATAATTAFPGCSFGCVGIFVPVPEPGTLPVLAFAVAALGMTLRRGRG